MNVRANPGPDRTRDSCGPALPLTQEAGAASGPSALKALLDEFCPSVPDAPLVVQTPGLKPASPLTSVKLVRAAEHVKGQPDHLFDGGRWVEADCSGNDNKLRLWENATLIAEMSPEGSGSLVFRYSAGKDGAWVINNYSSSKNHRAVEFQLMDLEQGRQLPVVTASGDALKIASVNRPTDGVQKKRYSYSVTHALSPGGTHLAIAPGDTVQLFELEQTDDALVAKRLVAFDVPSGTTALGWSESGRWLMCSDAIVDAESGRLIPLGIAGGTARVSAFSFLAGDSGLVVATTAGELLRFDLAEVASKDTLYPCADRQLNQDGAIALALSPDGRHLAGIGDDRRVRVLDALSLQSLDADQPTVVYADPKCLRWQSNDCLRVGLSDRGLLDLHVEASRIARPFSFSELQVQLSAQDAEQEAVRFDGVAMEVCPGPDGVRVRTPDVAMKGWAGLQLSVDGKTAFVRGSRLLMSFDTATLSETKIPTYAKEGRLSQLANGMLVLRGDKQSVFVDPKSDTELPPSPWSVRDSLGSDRLLADGYKSLVVVDAQTQEKLQEHDFLGDFLQVDQSEARVVVWHRQIANIGVKKLEPDSEIQNFVLDGSSGNQLPSAVAWAPDGQSLFALTAHTLWRVQADGTAIASTDLEEGSSCMGLSDNGRYIAIGFDSGKVQVFEASKLRLHKENQLHEERVEHIAFKKDVLMSLSEDGWLGRHTL